MTAGILAAPGIMPARDRNGRAVIARIRVYQDGTTTPQPVYTAADLETAHAQPISSDDAGRFPLIWMDPEEGPVTLAWETDDGQARSYDGLSVSTSADTSIAADAQAALEAVQEIAGSATDFGGYVTAAGENAAAAASAATAAAASATGAATSATNAAGSATAAAGSATSASGAATTAGTQAGAAASSASAAEASADAAADSATAAVSSASGASTSAANAAASAAGASSSAAAAAGSATAAAGSATGAAASATVAGAAETGALAAQTAAELARDEAEAIADFDVGDYLAKADNLSGLADVSAARGNLGVAIGTQVQAHSANLDEYAAVNPTSAGLALLDDADASAQRTTLGLGSLATASTINGGNWSGADLAVADGGTGASSASAARANLGLGTAAVLNTGVASGDIPVLGSGGKLPAVDGSLLTGLAAGAPPVAWFRQEQVSNTANSEGTSVTAATWTRRDFNTTKLGQPFISLVSNQFTINMTGDYDIRAVCMASTPSTGGQHPAQAQLRLQDVTDSVTVVLGMMQRIVGEYYNSSRAYGSVEVSGRVSLMAGKVYEVQQYNVLGGAVFGAVMNSGSLTEIYTDIKISPA